MNVSAVGAPSSHVPVVHMQAPAAAAASTPSKAVVASSDSDGDSDGSKGTSVDVRA